MDLKQKSRKTVYYNKVVYGGAILGFHPFEAVSDNPAA